VIDVDVLRSRVTAFDRRAAAGTRRAAVAIAIVPVQGGWGAVLEERPATISSHAGQYALPGGLVDPGEAASVCALRETREELGVDPSVWEVLGQLDDYVTAGGTVVTPVVLFSAHQVRFRPSVAEVHAVLLLDLGTAAPDVQLSPPQEQPFAVEGAWPARSIVVDRLRLFAPTGAIVHQFLQLAHRGATVRVDDFREPAFADGRGVALENNA
tara:strand:+ start:23028 stop:23663 length:636 start_codon:yes stop_codon:yes gene_type:complete